MKSEIDHRLFFGLKKKIVSKKSNIKKIQTLRVKLDGFKVFSPDKKLYSHFHQNWKVDDIFVESCCCLFYQRKQLYFVALKKQQNGVEHFSVFNLFFG